MGKMNNRLYYGTCDICGNTSGYDKKSLEGSIHNINGRNIILCCPCEDDLLKKLAKGRGINISYGDSGEISKVKIKGIRLIHPNMERIRKIINDELMSEEAETVLNLIEWC